MQTIKIVWFTRRLVISTKANYTVTMNDRPQENGEVKPEEQELLELMEKNIDPEVLKRLRETPERTEEPVLVGDYYVSSQGTGYAYQSGN
jgi:hypothetical protein